MYINKQHAIATFPLVMDFTDCRDIDRFVADLNSVFELTSRAPDDPYKQVRGSECGFCEYSKYWGVIYIGHRPSKAVIDMLLEKAGYVLNDSMMEN